MDVWQVCFVAATLPLSDKTMTQYDEKQRRLSVIVHIRKKKMTHLSIAVLAVSACASVHYELVKRVCDSASLPVCVYVLEGLPEEQMALSNTSA